MEHLVAGLIAHVDAGKTTLAEGLLFRGGVLRRQGRVDRGDTFLDTDARERARGITIFSKQALLTVGDTSLTLLDTPGHVDFSPETERTLRVLDAAILVINGAEGVQSHTRTLWQLLRRNRIPTFLFINKMDLPNPGRDALIAELTEQLGAGFVDFTEPHGNTFLEQVADCSEALLEEALCGSVKDATVAGAVAGCRLFPCLFGSALKLDGIDAFLETLLRYMPRPAYAPKFGARIFKVSRNDQGARLVHMKITGGLLKAKEPVTVSPSVIEKADRLHLYSGEKYRLTEEAFPGMIVAVSGLDSVKAGMGLGFETDAPGAQLEPVLKYRVRPKDGSADIHRLWEALNVLSDEEPTLQAEWNAALREISVCAMGDIQLEIVTQLLKERFSLDAVFLPAGILYKETVAMPVRGYGHYEPLKHYAEVHLRIEPLSAGSGFLTTTACREDVLDRNWQRLILTHLNERRFPGALTGSPVTDVRVTLLTGKAHLKHTEGGDFRQATYRAVRQALRSAESVLLEPWYAFSLTIPQAQAGRALSDLTRMGASFAPPETEGSFARINGQAPVSEMREYHRDVIGYTHGEGRLSCLPCGYRPCHNAESVISAIGYDADADIENTADSVFCDHGAGVTVRWDKAPQMMHLPIDTRTARTDPLPPRDLSRYGSRLEEDKELMRIFERTYGPIRGNLLRAMRSAEKGTAATASVVPTEEYLLVDGYNILYACSEPGSLCAETIDAAREKFIERLIGFNGYRGLKLIVVFDAYRVKGNPGDIEQAHGITVVYTKEAETADTFIEKASYNLVREGGKARRVRVATGDRAEQLIIIGNGAFRMSAAELLQEVEETEARIRALLDTETSAQSLKPLMDGTVIG